MAASINLDAIVKDLNKRFAAPFPEFFSRCIIFWYDEEREFEESWQSGCMVMIQNRSMPLPVLLKMKCTCISVLQRFGGSVGRNRDFSLCQRVHPDARKACEKWIDVRIFGQVFAFKKDKKGNGISVGVRVAVSINMARSISSIDINSMQITKSVNGEPSEKDKKVQTPWGPGIWLILGYTR